MSRTIKLSKILKLKSGTILPIGSILEWIRPGSLESVGVWMFNGIELKLRYTAVMRAPSIRTLEKWEGDGYCKTVLGERTEPDGTGSDGEPSWLLALGMI